MRIETGILDKMMASQALKDFVDSFNVSVTLLLTIATLVILIMTIVNIVRLSASADNPQGRSDAIRGLAVCLVCFAIVGGMDTVYAIVVSFLI